MKIPSVLEKIVATKIDEVEQRKSARPIIDLADRLDAPRGFKRALVDSVERGKSAPRLACFGFVNLATPALRGMPPIIAINHIC